MGVFDRLANVGKGWVTSKRSQARDADLVGAAERKLAQARDALARVGQSDPALDEEEARLRAATAAEVASPTPKPGAGAADPDPSVLPDPEPGLGPERDAEGKIIKRL